MRMLGKLAVAVGATAAVLLAAPAANASDSDRTDLTHSVEALGRTSEAQPKLGLPLIGSVPIVSQVAGGLLGGLLGGGGVPVGAGG
ncbi:hypothetical protein [Saccharothrix longispora]|uniref:hypothetical protein n=1 Tax=Saccharothrix longispora TaxID=33920 RepID=UPI0028FD2DAB|nr:hypothetical protein [Saccharothrix longispora]MDU0291419.1 hypothetical protein [Saccharothrix longispora]